MSCDIQHHPNYVTLEIDEQMLRHFGVNIITRMSAGNTLSVIASNHQSHLVNIPFDLTEK